MQKGPEKPILWIVVGPTASGKTALAIALAQSLKTEVVSFDSRQFYVEMNIGTAKPTKEEMSLARHHFISTKSIHTAYSSGAFASDALQLLSNSPKKNMVLVGGSGLYLNALLFPFHELPEVEQDIRNAVIESYKKNGLDWLKLEVARRDAESFQRIDSNNPQRLMRVLEICLQTGATYSQVLLEQKQKKVAQY